MYPNIIKLFYKKNSLWKNDLFRAFTIFLSQVHVRKKKWPVFCLKKSSINHHYHHHHHHHHQNHHHRSGQEDRFGGFFFLDTKKFWLHLDLSTAIFLISLASRFFSPGRLWDSIVMDNRVPNITTYPTEDSEDISSWTTYLNKISSFILPDEKTLQTNEIRKMTTNKSKYSQFFIVSKKKNPSDQSSQTEWWWWWWRWNITNIKDSSTDLWKNSFVVST